jgi:hypothetical protein
MYFSHSFLRRQFVGRARRASLPPRCFIAIIIVIIIYLFIYLFYFYGHQMEEILSGGTPAGAADHSPLATSLGDFEVLGSELDAEGTTTAPPSLCSTASSQRL